jgi:long-chain acyl-CoA synthetase
VHVEVEAALLECPGVLEAAVIGVPHERWGEAVHAVVYVDGGAGLDGPALLEHCRGRIAGYKVPRTIDLRTEPLPRSGAGKLLKHELREPLWAGHTRRIA